MYRACMYCKKIYGEIEPLEDKDFTHGICDKCKGTMTKKYFDYKENERREMDNKASELSEEFKEYKKSRKQKKVDNSEHSIQLLIDNGIEFLKLNNGVHLRLRKYDFWPSTGMFIDRKTGNKGRGIYNLINKIKEGGDNAYLER